MELGYWSWGLSTLFLNLGSEVQVLSGTPIKSAYYCKNKRGKKGALCSGITGVMAAVMSFPRDPDDHVAVAVAARRLPPLPLY